MMKRRGHSRTLWIAFKWGLNLGCFTLQYTEKIVWRPFNIFSSVFSGLQ